LAASRHRWSTSLENRGARPCRRFHRQATLVLEVNEMSLQTEERGATAPERTAPSDPAYDKARERARALQGLSVHLFVFALVNGALFLINWATRGPDGDWWFYWALLGWGVAVVIHLATTFLPVFSPDWVERRATRMAGRRPASR
jgi:2TM domain